MRWPGTYGLRGKGPFAYQESIHLPMYVMHPDVRGGQHLNALTSHIDLVPSLLSMAGVAPTTAASMRDGPCPGKGLQRRTLRPGKGGPARVRDSVLFTLRGWPPTTVPR